MATGLDEIIGEVAPGSEFLRLQADLGGWKSLRETLRLFDAGAEREMVKAIRGVASFVVTEAKGRASGWARSGDFVASIGQRTYARGVKVVSSDPAAGVLEYAHAGATALSGRRVGTPAGAPNKALTKAVEENEQYIVQRVDEALARALDRVRGN